MKLNLFQKDYVRFEWITRFMSNFLENIYFNLNININFVAMPTTNIWLIWNSNLIYFFWEALQIILLRTMKSLYIIKWKFIVVGAYNLFIDIVSLLIGIEFKWLATRMNYISKEASQGQHLVLTCIKAYC